MGTDKASVETILCDAIEIESDSDRAAFVERACAGDAALRHEVERLIARHQGAGNFLENRAGQMTQEAITLPVADRPGQQIGPYKLRELLGEGGMGMVFGKRKRRLGTCSAFSQSSMTASMLLKCGW